MELSKILNEPENISRFECHFGGTYGRKLCNNEQCQVCFNRSFAIHKTACKWSSRNTKNPRQIFKSTVKRFWFDCTKCGHTFMLRPFHAKKEHGQCCPYCASKKLCDDDNCQYCFNKSFASHKYASRWSSQNLRCPRQMFKGTNAQIWLDCASCEKPFSSSTQTLARLNEPFCSFCRSVTKKKFYDKLRQLIPDVVYHFKPKWNEMTESSSDSELSYGFVIENARIIIEIDNMREVAHKYVQMHEHYKMICAWNNKFAIIRATARYIRSHMDDVVVRISSIAQSRYHDVTTQVAQLICLPYASYSRYEPMANLYKSWLAGGAGASVDACAHASIAIRSSNDINTIVMGDADSDADSDTDSDDEYDAMDLTDMYSD